MKHGALMGSMTEALAYERAIGCPNPPASEDGEWPCEWQAVVTEREKALREYLEASQPRGNCIADSDWAPQGSEIQAHNAAARELPRSVTADGPDHRGDEEPR